MAGTLVVDTLKSSTSGPPTFQNTSGTTVGSLCRAWVNFVGSSAAINASFNVSSVTRNSTGDYTINFTTAMSDSSYAVVGTAWYPSAQQMLFTGNSLYTYSTTAVRVLTVNSANGSVTDAPIVNAAIFR